MENALILSMGHISLGHILQLKELVGAMLSDDEQNGQKNWLLNCYFFCSIIKIWGRKKWFIKNLLDGTPKHAR